MLALPYHANGGASLFESLSSLLRRSLWSWRTSLTTSLFATSVQSAPPAGQIWRSYYFAGSTRVAMREETSSSDTITYLAGDHLGSTSLTLGASGAKIGEMKYYPYGETRPGYPSGSVPTDRRFTGQRQEDAAALGSLYDYGARFYSVSLGRFISADTVVPTKDDPQQLNRYSYVRDNPLRHIDPSGHMCLDGPLGDKPGPCPREPKSLPGANFYSETYGYLDASHFRADIAQKIIIAAARNMANGGPVNVSGQGFGLGPWLRGDFSANYEVAPYNSSLDESLEDYIIRVSLGIYEDYQMRFEAWEGTRFSGFSMFVTGFAIEDLPSDYIGFLMAAKDMSQGEIFDRLGGVVPVDHPPRCLTGCVSVNASFNPLVNGKHVPWPEELNIVPIDAATGAWNHVSQSTNESFLMHELRSAVYGGFPQLGDLMRALLQPN